MFVLDSYNQWQREFLDVFKLKQLPVSRELLLMELIGIEGSKQSY